jgi:hypothetical protein
MSGNAASSALHYALQRTWVANTFSSASALLTLILSHSIVPVPGIGSLRGVGKRDLHLLVTLGVAIAKGLEKYAVMASWLLRHVWPREESSRTISVE